ncbi:MAG: glutamine-hydrolyzing GMP synthase [Promethearchaeota archaeon]|jgi:GMP synthase (glutamine-hydrolysing)
MKLDTILVLDFGGQYCHLIARRIREYNVYSEIVRSNITLKEIEEFNNERIVKGMILSGGPSSVYVENAPTINPQLLELTLPVLGLCYGHQLIAYLSDGEVKVGNKREYGITNVIIDKPVGVLNHLNQKEKVWMSHGDTVYRLPEEYERLAHTSSCPIAAYRHKKKPIYGLQWHPEVVHTENGMQMLKNYIFEICGCQANWNPEEVVERVIQEIRNEVGDKKAISAVSGGIDSSLATILTSKAIEKNLNAVFVDHGFMREGEGAFVKEIFKELDMNFTLINVEQRFIEKMKGIIDPEKKRKIIGHEFIAVFEEVARKIGADYLIQGTIYPDRIESGVRNHSEKIKTHHNVAGIPLKIEFKGIVEPLKDLYKDEVRKIAESLGLPPKIVWRQPFPGPGLAVRITGEVTKEKINLVRRADKIVEEEIEKTTVKRALWQYFAVLIDTKSTGVKGDSRAYGYTVAIRAVESKEAMTASFAKIPYDLLEKISTRITNELPSVTRVVFDITHKPPATIEWE